MPRTANAYKIGIFAIICIAITAAALIWIGAYSYLRDTRTYASYFEESIRGLQKDAIVNYRGVGVGHVSSIRLAPDGRLIEVLLELNSDFRVDETVAMQLREQGLTGLRYLEIDRAPDNIDELTPKITFATEYPILRTYPSEIQQLKVALEDIYQKISALDIKRLVDTWSRTSELVNNLLVQFGAGTETGDIKETIAYFRKTAESSSALLDRINAAASQEGLNKGVGDLAATLAATRNASETLSRQLAALPPEQLKQLTHQLQETFVTGGTTFSNINRHLDDSSALIEQNLQQFKILLTQLNSLVQSLREQPNRLVFPSKEQPDPFDKRK